MLTHNLQIKDQSGKVVFKDVYYAKRDIKPDSNRKSTYDMEKKINEYERLPKYYIVSITEGDK